MKKRYRVDPTRVLLHNGERYEGGQTVLLEEDAARNLLELGAILELEQESEQATEQDSQTAPIESETDTEPDPTTESRRRGRPRSS
jgi:hypothetical protein